jgi:hypothetical protein
MSNQTTTDRPFYHPDYAIGCGGTETPISFEGETYLYVWNHREKRHEYYCFSADRFIADDEAPWMDVPRMTWPEWNEIRKDKIIDPDGFRSYPNNFRYSRKEYMELLDRCTVELV